MADFQYNVGDIVIIRDWDDMVAEYGMTSNSLYITPDKLGFAPGMKSMCGNEYVICHRYIQPVKHKERYNLSGFEDRWVFSPGMFREDSDKPVDVDALRAILLQ